jgi:hypothetical protein
LISSFIILRRGWRIQRRAMDEGETGGVSRAHDEPDQTADRSPEDDSGGDRSVVADAADGAENRPDAEANGRSGEGLTAALIDPR